MMNNNMEELDLIDVSEEKNKKDTFMKNIYISLIVLIVLGLLVYFFGYNIFKPFIKV